VFILADFHIGYSPEHEGRSSTETLATASVSVAICYNMEVLNEIIKLAEKSVAWVSGVISYWKVLSKK
jgi:hypothetical protein